MLFGLGDAASQAAANALAASRPPGTYVCSGGSPAPFDCPTTYASETGTDNITRYTIPGGNAPVATHFDPPAPPLMGLISLAPLPQFTAPDPAPASAVITGITPPSAMPTAVAIPPAVDLSMPLLIGAGLLLFVMMGRH